MDVLGGIRRHRGVASGPGTGPQTGTATGSAAGTAAGTPAGTAAGTAAATETAPWWRRTGPVLDPARGRALLASPRWRGALAVLCGALPALAFPAPSWWWFAYVALVPWLLLARSAPTGRRAAVDGWLGGLGFMIAVHHWLLPSLHVFTLILAALLGLLWAPWGWLVRHLLGGAPSAGRAAAALLVLPSGWLMVELVRSWEGLGGPWGLLGSSQWQVEPALRLASVGGVWLVSALVVAVNTSVAVLAAHRAARVPALAGLVAVAAASSAVWVWSPRPEAAGSIRVAVVQPGVMNGLGGVDKRFAREEELTRALAGRDLDLVVWGESSVGHDLADRPDLAARLTALSRQVGADILVNVDARRSDRPGIFKSSVLVGPEGPTGDRYDKMRLVPFGEYVPARSLLGWATSVGKAAGEDRRRGERPVVMDVGHGLRVGPLVCFESAFPDMSRHLTREGAQLLLAQSSTSTFQHSWAPEQHASLAAVRAAETGRPMVHATLTGVSAAYGPSGERLGPWLGTSASATAEYEIPLATGTTPYARLGDWPVYTALGVLALFGAAGAARAFRKPAPERQGPPARTAHGSPARPGR
ncbi:apolipoprotein N-acyltransferase [Streptomyces sp. p1417]|uniref:Apolipoprotein N-acyltransferase n=1 Tax=Streptomyces typhae TaxID=2681492 RepID=A0A6L6X3A1_9ACTN|nr:apolipoprotein N-acyltransferase [Streptomyces typhae]